MKEFNECKALLRAQLIGLNPSLAMCANFAKDIYRLARNAKLDQKMPDISFLIIFLLPERGILF